MSLYLVEIVGSTPLNKFGQAIAGEEATGAQFASISISYHNGRITNLATFNDLPPGQRPQNPLVIITADEAIPDGKTPVWAGVVVASGSNVAVKTYR